MLCVAHKTRAVCLAGLGDASHTAIALLVKIDYNKIVCDEMAPAVCIYTRVHATIEHKCH